MTITNDEIDHAPQLKLAGGLTISQVSELKTRLVESCKNNESLHVDLSEVSEIDTAGLQLLCALKFSHKSIVFSNPSRAVSQATDLFKLTDLLISGTAKEEN